MFQTARMLGSSRSSQLVVVAVTAITFGYCTSLNADSPPPKITGAAIRKVLAGEGKLTESGVDRIFGFAGEYCTACAAGIAPVETGETVRQWKGDLYTFTVVFGTNGQMTQVYTAFSRPLTTWEKFQFWLNDVVP